MTQMLTPVELARQVFRDRIGVEAAFAVQAPGRVNLIGEHTDYNDGFVLPCAIDYHTAIACKARSDDTVRVIAVDFGGEEDCFDLSQPMVPVQGAAQWPNYVRGVVQVLQQRKLALRGVDMVISGNVPPGAGLSSSAALEVAVGQVFRQLCGLQSELSPTDLALVGQQAENEFVGCQCGIMDQLISARGEQGRALLIDCRSLEATPVPIPPGYAIMIIHSNVKRTLVGSEYNTRREQCESAARHFGIKALRDLSLAQLQAAQSELDPVVFRRARHVVTENARTQAAAQALAAQDMAHMSQLMAESHASMRDDFEITVPPIDALVEIVATEVGSQGGARMTGGGFGGCVVALVARENAERLQALVQREYFARCGLQASVWLCSASAGSHLL